MHTKFYEVSRAVKLLCATDGKKRLELKVMMLLIRFPKIRRVVRKKKIGEKIRLIWFISRVT